MMRRVIIESPYAGNSRWRVVAFFQRVRNCNYACAAVRDSLMRGEAQLRRTCFIPNPESCGMRSPEKDNRELTPDWHGVTLLRRPSFMPIGESARA